MGITLAKSLEWTPHPSAATVNTRSGDRFTSRANGTRSCCGGWQLEFAGVHPGHAYRIRCPAQAEGIAVSSDALACFAIWGTVEPDDVRLGTRLFWDYVCAPPLAAGGTTFDGTFVAPPDCSVVTVRPTLRWTDTGSVTWGALTIEDLGVASERPPVRVAVATGTEEGARASRPTLEDGIAYYAGLAEEACGNHGAELVALPEIGLQWHVPGHAFDKAVSVPGPETDRFAEIARRHGAVIVVGLHERDGDAVFNSAVTIDRTGDIAGVYHKVHLASFEAFSGVLPGDDFPVHDTAVGRIGCNICMDSSAAESSRMVGLNGADFLVLPIMGDHRACIWHRGNPVLDEDRWRCIMRTRAMDNQLTMVVARNCSVGSCIVDRSGKVLAYNDGTTDLVVADVARDDGYRKWNGGCFRQVNWRQRRPHIYGAFIADEPDPLHRLREAPPL